MGQRGLSLRSSLGGRGQRRDLSGGTPAVGTISGTDEADRSRSGPFAAKSGKGGTGSATSGSRRRPWWIWGGESNLPRLEWDEIDSTAEMAAKSAARRPHRVALTAGDATGTSCADGGGAPGQRRYGWVWTFAGRCRAASLPFLDRTLQVKTESSWMGNGDVFVAMAFLKALSRTSPFLSFAIFSLFGRWQVLVVIIRLG
uniref:Uncharacterized protein n=1 Tax=Oryza meridionalis TaxID=40149 RepID=A0A0E0DY67_9ORYZ